jgi:hypothetical protein
MRLVAGLLIVGCIAVAPAHAADQTLRVQIVEPYLDLHTGPGRGYPVTQVVERGEWVQVLRRRTGWFKVRTDDGREGWVSRDAIETTVTGAGEQTRFRDVSLEHYLSRRFELSFAGGVIESDPYMAGRFGYRFTDNLTVESTLGQIAGEFSSTTLYSVAVVSQPFPEWRVSPFLSLGLGRFKNVPKATLVGAIETDSNMADAGVGINIYVTRNFLVRADYRRHVVFVDANRTNEYNELSLGIGVFLH